MILRGLRAASDRTLARGGWRTPDPRRRYDAVIAGGGPHGLAAAYDLAFRHRVHNIAVLTEGLLTGGSRPGLSIPPDAAPRDPVLIQLLAEARTRFRGWPRDDGGAPDPKWRESIEIANGPDGARTLLAKANAHLLAGAEARVLGEDDLRARLSLLDVSAGTPPFSGVLYPKAVLASEDEAIRAYAIAADALGVDIIETCKIERITVAGGRLTHIETSRGVIETDRLALASGAGASKLATLAGIRLPLDPEELVCWISEPIEAALSPIVAAEELSLAVAQAASGELVIRDLGEPRTRNAPLGTYPRIERAFTRCARLFPRLKGVRIVDRRHETLERGTDRRPIVGPLPVGGLYLSCGFGAGALEWLALSGSILADFLAGREPPALAAPLAFSRFETPAATTATGA